MHSGQIKGRASERKKKEGRPERRRVDLDTKIPLKP